MDVDGENAVKPPTEAEPETECFISVLVLTYLVDQRRLDDARKLSERLIEQIVNHFNFDSIRAHTSSGQLESPHS